MCTFPPGPVVARRHDHSFLGITGCEQDKALFCGKPDVWFQKAKSDLAAKEALIAKCENDVKLYKKQKMREHQEDLE